MQTNTDSASEKEPPKSDDSASGKKRSALTLVREWSEMIKIEHTVFALPFALSGFILASVHIPKPEVWFFTIIAFAGARSAAMTLNRLIDASIDKLNPRTSSRAIPAGKISSMQASIFAVLSFALMIGAAANLPPLCLYLSPVAVLWLSFYSFTKRFTWTCHLVLGIALGGAALGGWIAAGGMLSSKDPWLLALAVSSWVAGFDIIYALQDLDFDREQRLHSIPARFGIANALIFSGFLHLLTVTALVLMGLSMQLGAAYWVGVAMVGAMLKYEHSLVKADDLSKIGAAFFNTNGIVSIATFAAILLDHILRGI